MDLTDLTVIPMIILGIATSIVVIHQITGWNMFVVVALSIIPGYALGVVMGLLLAFLIGTLLEFFIKIGKRLG